MLSVEIYPDTVTAMQACRMLASGGPVTFYVPGPLDTPVIDNDVIMVTGPAYLPISQRWQALGYVKNGKLISLTILQNRPDLTRNIQS